MSITKAREAASAMGKLGGKARAKKLTRERRIEIARMGGMAAAKKLKAQA